MLTQEKDAILCQLEQWEGQKLEALLERFGHRHAERVRGQIDADLTALHEVVQDPLKRQAAAAKLANLALPSLRNAVFDEAKRRAQTYELLLRLRNVEDDKALYLQLDNNDFRGLKELLGQVPEKENAETEWAKVFHRRLSSIQEAVADRMSLAKQSIFNPPDFAEEFGRVREANKEVGEYLKLYKDCHDLS